jgi:hypothetical protein
MIATDEIIYSQQRLNKQGMGKYKSYFVEDKRIIRR